MLRRGRRPAREPSAPRASLGALSRSPARPRRRPWARSQAVPTRWPGSETAIAFAGAGRASTETVIAFAGAKWVFLSAVFGCRGDVGFSGPSSGVCSGVVGFNVAMVSCLVREKVRPAALCHRESAKKFALHAQNTPKSAFLRLLGEFFRGRAAGGAVLGEFFRANSPCVDLGCDAVHFRLAAMGVLRHAKPSDGVSPACRRLGWRHSPRLVAVRPRCLMCAQQCRT